MSDALKKPMPKWLAILVDFLVLAVFSGIVSNCTEGALENGQVSSTSASKPAEKLPVYKIVEREDISVGATPRFAYRVSVEGTPTPKQLRAVADEVFKSAQAGKDFSALVVFFFDYPEYAISQYTLGKVEYAPDGDWAKASTIEPGDYDSMKATADLPTKDWSKRLTADEVKVWAAWEAEYDKAAAVIGSDPSKTVDEDAVSAKVAASVGKSADEVESIVLKQISWANQ